MTDSGALTIVECDTGNATQRDATVATAGSGGKRTVGEGRGCGDRSANVASRAAWVDLR